MNNELLRSLILRNEERREKFDYISENDDYEIEICVRCRAIINLNWMPSRMIKIHWKWFYVCVVCGDDNDKKIKRDFKNITKKILKGEKKWKRF